MNFRISITKLLCISGACTIIFISFWYKNSNITESWLLQQKSHPLTRVDLVNYVVHNPNFTRNENVPNANIFSTSESSKHYEDYDDDKKSGKNSHLINHSCLNPIPDPVLGANDFSRIINMGMPKAGSTSLTELFNTSSGFNHSASHWKCGEKFFCGECIEEGSWLLNAI